ncbi:hypothetical protein [Streptomyces rimosus]|uniref:hypothetical protein n=1 Tax=Streptomyces rimosus TaxID=1927 RepID=UPI0004C1750F|nr:hypothetical protein [Streptomyces rimosus]
MDCPQQAAQARLITAEHAREVADFARGIVGEISGEGTAADRILAARRLRLLSLQVLQWTVRAEALAGTPWSELAAALCRDEDSVQAEFEAGTRQWAERQAADPDAESGAPEAARALDAWYRRHADALLDPEKEAPVTGLFTCPDE